MTPVGSDRDLLRQSAPHATRLIIHALDEKYGLGDLIDAISLLSSDYRLASLTSPI